MIPLVAASEKGEGQTESILEKEIEMWWGKMAKASNRSSLKRGALKGDSPVGEGVMLFLKEYGSLEWKSEDGGINR